MPILQMSIKRIDPGHLSSSRCRGSVNERGYYMALNEVGEPLFRVLASLCEARAEQADNGTPIPSQLWAEARMLLAEISNP